jgi:hypothetical protein
MLASEENNLGNYKLLDVLMASPYHSKTCMDGWLTEARFKELLIEYTSYFALKDDIEKQLNNKSVTQPFIRFLKGYSGTGKTTFVHWFCDTCKDRLIYAFLDFSDTDDFVHRKKGDRKDYEYQLENRLLPLISLIFEKNPDSFYNLLKYLFDNSMKFFTYFASDFFRSLEKAVKNDDIDKLALIEFLNSRLYSELFLVLLLYYNKYDKHFLKCTNGNEKLESEGLDNKNLLLFIDNLDSIKMETYSKDIPKHFISIYRKYLEIIKVDSDYFANDKKIDFCYIVRDTIHSVINPQEEDYANLSTIHFSPNIDETKQYLIRLEFAKKYKIGVDEKTELLLTYIFQDNATIKSFLPLFNYNNRKIASNIHRIAIENNVFLEPIESLIKTKSKSSTIGVRGIFYFLFLRFMKEKDFFNESLFSDEGYLIEINAGEKAKVHINPIRIILTILLNLGKYHLDIASRQDYVAKVGLFDVYLEYKKIFENLENKEQRFFDIIARLFLFYENNWCHLVTLTNKEIMDLDSFCSEVKLLKEYENKKDEEIKKTLNRIKINLNASGYIYLKDIVRHYEFFSMRTNSKPLFASLNVEIDRGRYTYEFMSNIEKTFEVAKNCIHSLTDFLGIDKFSSFEEGNCCYRLFNKEDSIEGDFDSGASFYDSHKRNGRLFINRIIDHHTEYLDNMRIYLSGNYSLIEKYSTIIEKTRDEIIIEINTKILRFIDKYVLLYYVSANQFERNLKKIQMKNIERIKELINNKEISKLKEVTINDFREYV